MNRKAHSASKRGNGGRPLHVDLVEFELSQSPGNDGFPKFIAAKLKHIRKVGMERRLKLRKNGKQAVPLVKVEIRVDFEPFRREL